MRISGYRLIPSSATLRGGVELVLASATLEKGRMPGRSALLEWMKVTERGCGSVSGSWSETDEARGFRGAPADVLAAPAETFQGTISSSTAPYSVVQLEREAAVRRWALPTLNAAVSRSSSNSRTRIFCV